MNLVNNAPFSWIMGVSVQENVSIVNSIILTMLYIYLFVFFCFVYLFMYGYIHKKKKTGTCLKMKPKCRCVVIARLVDGQLHNNLLMVSRVNFCCHLVFSQEHKC